MWCSAAQAGNGLVAHNQASMHSDEEFGFAPEAEMQPMMSSIEREKLQQVLMGGELPIWRSGFGFESSEQSRC